VTFLDTGITLTEESGVCVWERAEGDTVCVCVGGGGGDEQFIQIFIMVLKSFLFKFFIIFNILCRKTIRTLSA
jgi:hypothetical protein